MTCFSAKEIVGPISDTQAEKRRAVESGAELGGLLKQRRAVAVDPGQALVGRADIAAQIPAAEIGRRRVNRRAAIGRSKAMAMVENDTAAAVRRNLTLRIRLRPSGP